MSPLPFQSGALGQVEGNVGQIDDDAIGFGEREYLRPARRPKARARNLVDPATVRISARLASTAAVLRCTLAGSPAAPLGATITRHKAKHEAHAGASGLHGSRALCCRCFPHPLRPHQAPPSPPLTKPFPIFPQIAESWPAGLRRTLITCLQAYRRTRTYYLVAAAALFRGHLCAARAS